MTEAQIRDDLPISFKVRTPQILQEATTLTDHFEKPAPTVVILLVLIEMAPKVVDSGGQEGDLDRSAAPILVVQLELLDDVFAVDGHSVRASTGVNAAGEAPLCMESSKS
jgi:hypothetical protein